jgi:DNA repair protein RecN (Recombination protein N)
LLLHLQIRDFALIEAVELELRPGLTVLTGETGAGKSIIVEALELVAGGRAGPEVIRHTAPRAEISASFSLQGAPGELVRWLEEHAIAADQELNIRRVVTNDGRSRAYINGQSVPVQLLREAGSLLVDIHGQHEFQSLTRAAAQRELLDVYGRHESLAEQVGIAHRVWLSLLNSTLELETQARDREQRLSLAKHQIQELEALALADGEHASLVEERTRLANRGRLIEGAHLALGHLYEAEDLSAHAGASRALAALRGLSPLDSRIAAFAPLVEGALIQIREAARELQHYVESLEMDTARQDQVELRLAAIEDLARKHRVAPADLPERARRLAADLASLETAEEDLAKLRKDLAAALAHYRELAARLSARRATAARSFAKEITARMQMLGMAGGRFQVDVSPLESSEPAQHGTDQVEFRVTANPGQPPRPLAKVASGGELSRLSLAVQVSSVSAERPCMIFDEVDAGIGGAVAEIVGRELRLLAEGTQVLCVTHLPQVASQAHHHFRVSKLGDGRSSRTSLAELSAEERAEELARMLGGVEVTVKAREHAREMLKAVLDADAKSASSGTGRSAARSARTK